MTWPRRGGEVTADVTELAARALRLLAAREHSALEVRRKLLRRGDAAAVAQVVRQLMRDGLLSDERFAESFVHSRIERGQGPLKIRSGLIARGITGELIDRSLARTEGFWLERACDAVARRFGAAPPTCGTERGRRWRFLSGRGFPSDVAHRALRCKDHGSPL